jgi:hypothetical protein
VLYAQIQAKIIDPTAASEDGAFNLATVIAGSFDSRVWVGAGLYAEGLTDPGAGKANFTHYQIDNVPGAAHYLEYRDEKAANTAGGTFTSGAWRTRTLQTEAFDTGADGVLASNEITLGAGTYECWIAVPGYRCDQHQARLRNVTDTSTVLVGTSAFTRSADDSTVNASFITGRFTLASAKAVSVEHQCATTRATDGFGVAANLGEIETYTVARFWKVG